MNLIKKSPEIIILVVALLLLAIGAVTLAYVFPTKKEITGVTSTEPKADHIKPIKAEDIQAQLAAWDSPVLWQTPVSQNRMFHSHQYLFYPVDYPNGTYIKIATGDTRSPSGIPLRWYQKYGLSITDPNVDREDPDGDGFSNMTEFKNDPVGTRQNAFDLDGSKSANPQDAKDHPDYLARLRLQQYETRSFHILFTGYQQLNGVFLYQLRLKDVPSQNQPPLKKTGDPLGFEGYSIGPFHQEFQDIKDPNTGAVEHVDTSTLELDKPDIGFKIILPFRKEVDSPESTADFIMLMPNDTEKVLKVSRGKDLKILPYLPDVTFIVIDAGEKGAKIRDKKTNQEYNILKLDPKEWDEVPIIPSK